jgi:hypothetical protein
MPRRAALPRPSRAAGKEQRPAPERRSRADRRVAPSDRRASGRSAKSALPVEAVFFYLYDVGRSIDLAQVVELVPAHKDLGLAKRRDTPSSISLPTPLVLSLGLPEHPEASGFDSFTSQAKIYEEGVVAVVVRVKARLPLNELHSLETVSVEYLGRGAKIKDYAEEGFARLFEAVGDAIDEPRAFSEIGRESYIAYCLSDCGAAAKGDPAAFLERNREYLACLLTGEEPGSSLHESQIAATLGSPFFYRDGDLAVFELDRCLIIDPRSDYEDLLLIAEHANYQLLELRVLDQLLDKWLDEAEDDIRRASSGRRRLIKRAGRVEIKVAHIQALRFDALFILENLENSSKIIGDYYLGQVYARLCELYNTDGWKWSVERRLDTLQDVYEMAKTDTDERKLRWLEIAVIIVCVAAPIVEVFGIVFLK